MEQLRAFIDTCPLLDHHCHCLMELEPPVTVTSLSDALLGTLTEAHGKAREHAVHSIAVKRSIRELAAALSADAMSLEAVAAARLRLGDAAANQKLFGAARISALLIDDGLRGGVANSADWNWGAGSGGGEGEGGRGEGGAGEGGGSMDEQQQGGTSSGGGTKNRRGGRKTGEGDEKQERGDEQQGGEQGEGGRWRWRGVAWHEGLAPVVRRVLRLETLAEDILVGPAPGGTWTLGSFSKRFHDAIDPPPPGVVAFKTIAAYRCGLSIDPLVTPAEVELGIQAALASVARTSPPSLRLSDPRVISFCIASALAVAAKHQMPLQIHCGFGDRDLDLAAANPLCLRPLLEFNEGLVEEEQRGEAQLGQADREVCSPGSYAALSFSCTPATRSRGKLPTSLLCTPRCILTVVWSSASFLSWARRQPS
ncbi:hypothetical protein CLOM_g2800 [Closterium sp. NIES-68]|nr:hypothetical protein CLOM_g2800 [Closterium sp. NIES-68]